MDVETFTLFAIIETPLKQYACGGPVLALTIAGMIARPNYFDLL
jgi:hypothetical protein